VALSQVNISDFYRPDPVFPVHFPGLESRNSSLISGRNRVVRGMRPNGQIAVNTRRNAMNITRFEPWSLFDAMQRDFDRMAGRRLDYPARDDNGHSVADWVPAVDIVEQANRFVLRADVPGVKPEDIDVNMENGVLSVSGQRATESTEEADGVKRIERISGRFYRRFTLPESADADGISATSADGILEVVIPKRPEVKARRITVEAA
jgi:HSP20 family protein